MTRAVGASGEFAARVAGVFAARVIGFVFGVTASLVLARLLGRDGQGVYTTVITLVSLVFTFGQLGLPSAVTFFAGRGRSIHSLRRSTVRLTVAVSVVALVITVPLLPMFLGSIASSATLPEIALGLVALPLLLAAGFGGGILYGRRAIRVYAVIQVLQAAVSLVAVLVLVWLLGLGVEGALGAYVVSNGVGAVAVLWATRRLDAATGQGEDQPASIAELAGYGLRLYPASITSYFNYRADVLILNAVRLAESDIGLYARAVNFAELLFYLPDAISSIFYPTVAASSEGESHQIAPAVARFTVLLTGLGALAMVPAAWVVILLVLPSFTGSMAPLVILLPGIVSLSLSKVLSGYISGLGRPGAATIAAAIAMVVNLVANLLLVPIAGISGAAAASLISYTLHAVIMAAFASRVSGLPMRAFIVPGRAEAARVLLVWRTLWARATQRRRASA